MISFQYHVHNGNNMFGNGTNFSWERYEANQQKYGYKNQSLKSTTPTMDLAMLSNWVLTWVLIFCTSISLSSPYTFNILQWYSRSLLPIKLESTVDERNKPQQLGVCQQGFGFGIFRNGKVGSNGTLWVRGDESALPMNSFVFIPNERNYVVIPHKLTTNSRKLECSCVNRARDFCPL